MNVYKIIEFTNDYFKRKKQYSTNKDKSSLHLLHNETLVCDYSSTRLIALKLEYPYSSNMLLIFYKF